MIWCYQLHLCLPTEPRGKGGLRGCHLPPTISGKPHPKGNMLMLETHFQLHRPQKLWISHSMPFPVSFPNKALCFLQGNSGILQWWKDKLSYFHTKEMVIVFHFTCKLMDLGIPDVDAQNPLWSPSGDLSSLGCLWCTRMSAEVICELLHTKSRFLREEAQAHTHTPPTPAQAPSTPSSCTWLQGAGTWGGSSHPPGFAGQAAKARQGLLPRAELCKAWALSLSQHHGEGCGCCCPPRLAGTDPDSWGHGNVDWAHLSSLFLLCAAGDGRGWRTCTSQARGLHTEPGLQASTMNFLLGPKGDAYRNRFSAGKCKRKIKSCIWSSK